MRPLRYSINVTLDGCCDHQAMIPDEEMHRHAAEGIARADALIFGRTTYELMETGWRSMAETGVRPDWAPAWTEPFARTENDRLVQTFKAEDGQRVNSFSVEATQRLTLEVQVTSPRLPKPLTYTVRYKRAEQ